MSSHDEMLDLVAAYALGALPQHEASEVIAHLRDCAECRAEYRLLQPAVTAVAYSAEACADAGSGAAVASPLLKARIMKHVRGEVARPRAVQPWPAYAAAAACLALAIVAGIFDLSLGGRLAREHAQVVDQNQTIADFMAPDAQHHPFHGGEVLMHGQRIYLAMHRMPMPPPGKVYQAWTLAKGAKKVAPSKTFMPAPTGMTVVRLPVAATTLAAVAVSIEPEGGSMQPTSKPIALVSLQ
jgi:Anti-sigma-K factor rskA/Putative zinc-finger